jgi:hypothetical protein
MSWNNALADVMYEPHSAGLPAYLDVEDPTLERAAAMAGAEGSPRQALIDAVRETLNPPTHSAGIFGGHIRRLKKWNINSGEPPPVVTLLALLSLAAEDMRQSDHFAANNYYDRLMPLLGVDSPDDKRRVINSYRRVSFDLWESLNGWLEDLHGDRGLPTAYAYSHAHVGRPLSQALIRAADRDKLGEFFGELGLEPRSRLSPLDMEPLLAEWMTRDLSPASNHMRAMWGRQGARERITDIACQLLETWEPAPGAEQSSAPGVRLLGRAGGLHLLALVRTFPTRGLELNLTGPAIDGAWVVQLEDPATGAPVEPPLTLEALPGNRWRLGQADEIEPRSMLEGLIRVRRPDGSPLERRPRRVVPLKRDELLQAFVEVERLGLGEDGAIVCQEGMARLLHEALEQISRPGFKRVESDFPGLPPGWALFVAVQVLAPLSLAAARRREGWPLDFNVLEPLSTSQLILGGGLQLPGRVRRWSALAPPEVRVAAADAAGLTIRVERVGAFEKQVLELERSFGEPFAVVDLSEAGLRDGDYEVTVTTRPLRTAKLQKLTARLRLRSADASNPRPSTQPPIGHPIDDIAAATMMAVDWDENSVAIRGALVPIRHELASSIPSANAIVKPQWWSRRHERKAVSSSATLAGADSKIVLPGADFTDCFRTGAHVLRLPTFYGRTTKATVDGVCKHCGLVKRFPARYRPAKRRTSRVSHPTADPMVDVSEIAPVSRAGVVTADIALDALSHDHSGSGTSLEQVALQLLASQLFVDRFARSLDALGHIEVTRDLATTRLVGWEVMPTTLAEAMNGSVTLTGHRSRRLVQGIGDLCEELHWALLRTTQGPTAPDRLLIEGMTIDRADQLARSLEERTGIAMLTAPRSAHSLVAVLPPLSAVIDQLPRQPMVGAHSFKRWDVEVARWSQVQDASWPGAYQLIGSTTAYCLRDDDDVWNGTMRRADARFVKHAAALLAGQPLMGYEATSEMLYLPLGAELPGLYHRAAVLASGLLPVEDEKHHLVAYRYVPKVLAEGLNALMRS